MTKKTPFFISLLLISIHLCVPLFGADLPLKASSIQRNLFTSFSQKKRPPSYTRGKRGHRGKRGKEGSEGEKGYTGPSNSPISSLTAFVSAYEQSGTTILGNQNIVFSQNVSSKEFTHDASGVFTTQSGPGDYEIIFGAQWESTPSPIALYINDVLIQGTVILPERNLDYSTISIIIPTTTATTKFEIKNTSSDPIILSSQADASANAFITIKKIS